MASDEVLRVECPSADVFMPELRQATPGVLLSKPHALEATGHRSHVRGYELEPLAFTPTAVISNIRFFTFCLLSII